MPCQLLSQAVWMEKQAHRFWSLFYCKVHFTRLDFLTYCWQLGGTIWEYSLPRVQCRQNLIIPLWFNRRTLSFHVDSYNLTIPWWFRRWTLSLYVTGTPLFLFPPSLPPSPWLVSVYCSLCSSDWPPVFILLRLLRTGITYVCHYIQICISFSFF